MVAQGKYTKFFKSNDLTRLKYNELHDFAMFIREYKNEVSRYLSSHLLECIDGSRFEFINEMRKRYNGIIPSSFDVQIYGRVFDDYHTKFEGLFKKLQFEKITFKGVKKYKRDICGHKRGEIKSVIVDRNSTPLTTCLTYLVRYGSINTIEFINSQLGNCAADKRRFYTSILGYIQKFGFERLFALAVAKRARFIKKYNSRPLLYRSLSFCGRCRKVRILRYNKRFGSKINAFISLSGIKRKSFDIPVKFSKKYHGHIKDYVKATNHYEYALTFDDSHHQVTISLYKNGERIEPEASGDIVGIDVNCKHNLLSLSDHTSYDYDRELVADFCRLALETDSLRKSRGYSIGKRRQRKFDVLKRKMVHCKERIISNACKNLRSMGVGHVVMENLDNSFGRCSVIDSENGGINYLRKVKFLGLSSVKTMFRRIAVKYGIAVSTVHPCYTSKMCPVCGCIDDLNRAEQENFSCVECGHSDNADFNAAVNIRNRVAVAVLRDRLLKQLGNGTYAPIPMNKERVREVLLSYRKGLHYNATCESGDTGMTECGRS